MSKFTIRKVASYTVFYTDNSTGERKKVSGISAKSRTDAIRAVKTIHPFGIDWTCI
jgi:hypothetical protein